MPSNTMMLLGWLGRLVVFRWGSDPSQDVVMGWTSHLISCMRVYGDISPKIAKNWHKHPVKKHKCWMESTGFNVCQQRTFRRSPPVNGCLSLFYFHLISGFVARVCLVSMFSWYENGIMWTVYVTLGKVCYPLVLIDMPLKLAIYSYQSH